MHATRPLVAALAALTLLTACASGSSGGGAPPAGGGQASQPSSGAGASSGPKVIRLAVSREPNGFVTSLSSSNSTSGGAIQAQNIAANKLSNVDEKGTNFPELAEALPSTANGTWVINPDGTMETTWKLRPNIKWHDGQPVTADDVVFGYQASTAPGVVSLAASYLRNIKEVVALDSQSFVVRWSKSAPDADAPGDNLPVLPKHLLESELAKGGQSFQQLPYFTSEFMGNGPFKLDRWLPGDQLQFSAFDQYYRGRPKVDRVILRIMPDSNIQVATILSGELDVTLPSGIDADTALSVKDRWAGTNNQVLLASPGIIRGLLPNSRPEYQTPKELLDPRVRQALYRAVDRQGVSDAVTRGQAPIADSIIPPFYAVRKDVESAIVQYPFDLAEAARELQDLGWTKAPDGVLRNAQGQEFRFLVQGTAMARAEREMNSAVAGWKQLGIQLDQQIDPPTLTISDEDRAKRPGVGIPGGRADEFLTDRLSCDTVPTAATSWRGRNSGGWCNQEAQTFIDGLRSTVEPNQRIQQLRGLLGVLGRELPIMPMYWDLDPILVANGVKNVPMPSAPTRVSTFNIADWDKE
jgi:peptide/nickel transport system substrate-binding protein